jgi:deoxyadenosine/deoxycytidine kinase
MIVSIEAQIGAGKSSLIEQLANAKFHKPHLVIPEQVDSWSQVKDENSGKNILELFYSNKTKWSYMFQSYVLFSRIHHMLKFIKAHPDHIIICERSHLTDLMVFAESLLELGDLQPIEMTVYKKWHSMILDLYQLEISAFIYLKADVKTCMSRIKKRSRPGEETIAVEYLELLHKKHEEWLSSGTDSHCGKKVLLVDGGVEKEGPGRQNQINSIIEFVQNL